jgi:hypothetical protein
MMPRLVLAVCLGIGTYAQTPDSLVAVNYEVGSTVTNAPNIQTSSSVNARASVAPRKVVKAHVRFHNNSHKIITYIGVNVTYHYPDGTSETGNHLSAGFEQETLFGLHLTELTDPDGTRNKELNHPLTPGHEKTSDLILKADAGIPTVVAKPELVLFEDRTWVGDPALAQRVFSSRQNLSDEYAYILGIVREAKASADPVAVYQRYLDQWKAIGWTKNSISPKAVFRSELTPSRIEDYLEAEKQGHDFDLLLLRIDEASRSFYAEQARPVPPITAKGAK